MEVIFRSIQFISYAKELNTNLLNAKFFSGAISESFTSIGTYIYQYNYSDHLLVLLSYTELQQKANKVA